jgi:xanthine dehydrogenase accessory factor
VLATVVDTEPPTSARPGDKAVITADGRLRGWVGGSCSEPVVRREALRALAEGTARMVRILGAADSSPSPSAGDDLTFATTCPSGGSLEVFLEPRLPRPLLLVFGASPAAHTLVALGAQVGFRTCAVHPGARPEDFSADLVLPSLDLAPAAPGRDSWIVVATMGHYDEDALEAALAYPDVDVALVASRRRSDAVLSALRERGLDEATLRRVRAPAGGTRAGGQAEIALFALTEVVGERLRRERPPADLSAFATDPVCGMAVEVAGATWLVAHAAGTVYFCGEGCRDRFIREPERYGAAAR